VLGGVDFRGSFEFFDFEFFFALLLGLPFFFLFADFCSFTSSR
jgi:hypothetical protein